MHDLLAITRSKGQARTQAAVADDDQQAVIRGLVNGVILSLVVWLIVGYTAFLLH